MPHAVIVAHGQPSDPQPAEDRLAAFAAQVDALTSEVSVHSATLATSGALETCLDALPSGTAIYPLFMGRGWFCHRRLAEACWVKRGSHIGSAGHRS